MDGNQNYIHSSVIIPADVTIGRFNVIEEGVVFEPGCKVGNFNHIQRNSVFGAGTVIGNYCELGFNLKVGRNVIIQGRIRTADSCEMEDEVTLKYGTILTSGVLLRKNCFLGPNVITLGSTHQRVTDHGTEIGENTYIGAGAKIAAHVFIGNDVVVGANSFVNRDIRERGIYVGTPIRFLKGN